MNAYVTQGVCTKKITFSIDNELVKDVAFYSGCHGNLQGISSLIEGMNVYEAIKRLRGIKCGGKATSCPDQLSRALEEHINHK